MKATAVLQIHVVIPVISLGPAHSFFVPQECVLEPGHWLPHLSAPVELPGFCWFLACKQVFVGGKREQRWHLRLLLYCCLKQGQRHRLSAPHYIANVSTWSRVEFQVLAAVWRGLYCSCFHSVKLQGCVAWAGVCHEGL